MTSPVFSQSQCYACGYTRPRNSWVTVCCVRCLRGWRVGGTFRFWTKFLAYNLIRMTIGLAAKQESILPRTISFVSTCQYVLSNWDLACFSASSSDELIGKLLRGISQCKVGCRPGRFEPRCVKQRMDQYTLMMEPRNDLRKRLSKGDNSFE